MNIPIWLLGSSGFSAQLAGKLGLPFAFASHFAPEYLLQALHIYHSNFRPSAALDKPYVMVGVGITAADTVNEARRLATSQQQQFLNIIRGRTGKLQPPVDSMEGLWTMQEKAAMLEKQRYSFAGDKAAIKERLQEILQETQADELIVSGGIYDPNARLRSYEIVADAMKEI